MNEQIITQLIESAQGAEWAVLAGALLMVLVWLFQRVTSGRLPRKYLPLVNAAVAVVLAVATMLLAGVVWYEALATGLLVGATAGGFWSMVGKYLLPAAKTKE